MDAEPKHIGDRTILWRGWHTLVIHRYSSAWMEQYFRISLPIAFLFFLLAETLNAFAGIYATDRASNSVTDLILSNTPVFDVDLLFVYGALAFTAFVAFYLITHPKQSPFVLFTLGFFCLTRAIFVSLTHIGPYPDHAILDVQSRIILALVGGGGDEFFSAHTGFPFLMALLYWERKCLRYFFLASSLFFAAVVLLGHLHYTIDVLSAFFITYTIYHLSRQMFPREYTLFQNADVTQPQSETMVVVEN